MTSIQHTAPTSTPRRDTEPWQYAPPANHWLRMIYAALLQIRCLFTCNDGVEVAVEVEADEVATPLLDANPRSKKVVVVNTGANPAVIYEGAAVVAIVAGGATRELPMAGLLAISVAAPDTGPTVVVSATRYLRCACGDEEITYTEEPVGAFLL